MKKDLFSLVVAALLAVGMVGCGGGEDASDSGETAQAETGAAADAAADSSGEGNASTVPVKTVSSSTPSALASQQPPIDTLHPRVRISTTLGEMVVELDAEKAPLTVDNFLEYVDSGHYDGTIFHQVISDYVVIGGGYTPEFSEKPTRTPVRNEAHNGLSNQRGTIAMARADDVIDSATAQFFFNLADNQSLDYRDSTVEDYGYCVFGKVVEGMNVLDAIGAAAVTGHETFGTTPADPIVIQSVTRLRSE